MAYSFTNLSPPEFEDLARDLVGSELGIRFEGFCQGPDGGIDGRHASASGALILQAKHYPRSTFADLKRVMKKERAAINRLDPHRYILATSKGLTPGNKQSLEEAIGPALLSQGDIIGPEDLNTLLDRFPAVEKANIKLWLSSSAVLDRIINAATHFFTSMSREEVEAKVLVYAPNPSFREAQQKLEENHVLIVSGPPGVGKTTLAEMLSYAYIAEDWDFVAIRSLEDGFAAIVDAKKQIFFFDDFLGKVGLDHRALASKDSDLAKFIKRVRRTPNARFILTTRAHIFEEARTVSEHLGDRHLDITRYSLDVGIYTRQIKARILYNHLYVAGLPAGYVRALWLGGAIPKIIDHKNYNPRIIEAMTESVLIKEVTEDAYAAAFIYALDHPEAIWDKAFRWHIAPMCQHLLIALFFGSEYGVEIRELRDAFGPLHAFLCRKYGIQFGMKDFEQALKVLEGGFLAIKGDVVSLINPSLRDYLTSYLDDFELLSDLAANAVKADWAEAVWKRTKDEADLAFDRRTTVANSFLSIAEKFGQLPLTRPSLRNPSTNRFCDIAMSERVRLLLEWSEVSDEPKFADICMEIASGRRTFFLAWLDGTNLVKLISKLREGCYEDFLYREELANELEERLVEMFKHGMGVDAVEQLYRAIDAASSEFSPELESAAQDAAIKAFDDTAEFAETEDSQSTLRDHIDTFKYLALRAGVEADQVARTVTTIERRIEKLDETVEETPPSISEPMARANETFDNDDLSNLFAPLVAGDDPAEKVTTPITGTIEDSPF
ncbi:restriction endonuclease [Rhizobium sp. L245/93]|uniref:nSTAND3 domain-containing NTPase n=1 Tax=Rhizobium sp. L245/93 TaxID=2819998 RepID=UPI001ADC7B7C|nr:restriction endonuclease [Rhizobium sp. L245/93]MBO9170024.1 restriction endonuclease [Rhizobium sp. L245/93]